jgi:hypothetical protein
MTNLERKKCCPKPNPNLFKEVPASTWIFMRRVDNPTSIADPDPGSGAFLTPRIRDPE